MSGQSYSLSYNVDVKANAGSVKKLMSDLQNVLNGLTLPKGLADQFAQEFNKFGKEMAKYDASLLKGMPTDKKTMNQSNSSWSNIEASVLRVQQLMNTLGNMPGLQLVSKDAQAQIDGANRALEEYQQKIQAIRSSKGYKDLIEGKRDTSGKKTPGIADYEGEIHNIERRIRQYKSALSDATSEKIRLEPDIAKFMGGDPERILSQYEDISARLARIKGEIRSGKDVSGENDLLKTLGINPENTDQAISRIEQLQRYVKTLNDVSGNETRVAHEEGQLQQQFQRLEALKLQIQAFEQGQSAEPLKKLISSVSELTGIPIEKFGSSLEQVKQTLEGFSTSKIAEGANSFKNAEANANGLRAATEKAAAGQEKLNQAFNGFMTKEQDIANFKHRFSYFFSLTGITQTVRRVFRDVTNTIKELDSVMTETAVVTDFTVSDMWDKLPEYTKKASQLGTSIASLYEATTLYYQQGLGDQAAMDLGVETMKMARIANMDAADATEAMTAALRGFNMEINETSATRINDVYSELAAITAADTEQIATAMTKTASIASSANMEFETTAAFLAQIIETTQEAPETAGTAMKTIIARFTEVKKLFSEGMLSGEDEEGEAIEINKIDKALQSVGISLKSFLRGEKGIDDIFLELASKWDTLDLATQRYIATTAAGSRQQSRFIAMMSDYGRTMELVDAAQNSSGASQKQFDKTLDSLSSKMERLKNAWHEFTMGIIDSDLVKIGVDMLTKLLETVNKITSAFGKVGGPLAKIGVIMGGFKLGRGLFMRSTPGQAMTTMARKMNLPVPRMGGFIGQYRAENLNYAQTGYNIGKNPESNSYVPMQQAFGRMGFFGPSMKVANSYYGQGIAKLESEWSTLNTEVAELKKVPELKAAADAAQIKAQQSMVGSERAVDKMKQLNRENIGKKQTPELWQEKKELGLQASREEKAWLEANKANKAYQKQLEKTGYSTEKMTEKEKELAAKRAEIDQAKAQQVQDQKTLKLQQGYAIGQAAGTGLMLAGMGLNLAGAVAQEKGNEELAETFQTVGTVATIAGASLQGLTSIASALGTSLLTVGGYAVAVAAAIAAIVVVGKQIYKVTKEGQIKEAEKKTAATQEAADSSAQKYEDLNKSLAQIQEQRKTLKDMTKGTEEWNKAVLDLNKNTSDLIDQNPELAAFSKWEGGVLTIDNETEGLVYDAHGKASYITLQEYMNQEKAETLAAENHALETKITENMLVASLRLTDYLDDSAIRQDGLEQASVTAGAIYSQNRVWSGTQPGDTGEEDSYWSERFREDSMTQDFAKMISSGQLASLEAAEKWLSEQRTEDKRYEANLNEDAFRDLQQYGFYLQGLDIQNDALRRQQAGNIKEMSELYGTSTQFVQDLGSEFVSAFSDSVSRIKGDGMYKNLTESDYEDYADIMGWDYKRTRLGGAGKAVFYDGSAKKVVSQQDVRNALIERDSDALAAVGLKNIENVIKSGQRDSFLRLFSENGENIQGTDFQEGGNFNGLVTSDSSGIIKAANLYQTLEDGTLQYSDEANELAKIYSSQEHTNFADWATKELGIDPQKLADVIMNNTEDAANRIVKERKDLVAKMAEYSDVEKISGEYGADSSYTVMAETLSAFESKFGDMGREMLSDVFTSLEASGDDTVISSGWIKFMEQAVSMTESEAQDLSNTIGSINWASPIDSADQLADMVKYGSTSAKDFATYMQDTNSTFLNTGSQMRYLIGQSEEFSEMSNSIEEIIEQNGELAASDIYDLTDQYKSLKKIMDNTGTSAGSLAKILEAVSNKELGLHQITDAVLASIAHVDELDSIIAGLNKDFSEFDAGIDENFASQFIAQVSEAFKTNIEKGAFGNSQLDSYMDYLIGDEWDANLSAEERASALKSAGKFYEQNSENMSKGWKDMAAIMSGRTPAGFLGENFSRRGGDLSELGFSISQNTSTGEIELSGYDNLTVEQMASNMAQVFGITERMAQAFLTDYANYSSDFNFGLKNRQETEDNIVDRATEAAGSLNGKKIIDQSEIDAINKLNGTELTSEDFTGATVTNFYDENGAVIGESEAWAEFERISGQKIDQFKTTNEAFDEAAYEAIMNNPYMTDFDRQQALDTLDYKIPTSFDMVALEDQLANSGLSEVVQEQIKAGMLAGVTDDQGRATEDYQIEARLSDGSVKNIEVQTGQTYAEALNAANQKMQDDALASSLANALVSAATGITAINPTIDTEGIQTQLNSRTYTITVNGVMGGISGGDADSGGGTTGGTTSIGQKPHIGPSYASGLSSAKRPHAALTGELGPELIWRRSQNQFYLAGMNGPEMTTVNPADTVFTAEETKQILNQPDGPKMPGFAKGLSGPSYDPGSNNISSSGYGSLGSSGGKGSGDDKQVENPFDKLYNLLRKIDEELRERERIERRYEKLLEDLGVSADKIISISREELAQLEKERQYQEQLVSGRRDQINAYQQENSDLLKYASVTQNERGEDVLRIDWDLINTVDDKEEMSDIEEYVKQLEEWFDSLTEAEDAMWEIEDAIEEIKERGEDEYFDLEEAVKDAVEKSYQDQIDELEKINDSINDTNAELLEGIQKTINKQRQDRENEKTEEDLADKQRRLSYLQMDTSGANATEILKLQKEIEEGQENYTDTLIDQKISELQEQNDEAAKQREKQIDLLQAQLDHYLETGRIWEQVNKLMATGVDSVNGLIPGSELEQLLQNEAGFQGMSAIGKMEWMNETNNMIAQALAYLELGRQLEDIGVKAGTKIEFVTADGQTLTGTVDKDGVVTTADGKKYDNVYQTYDGTFRAGENIAPVEAEEVEGVDKGTSGSESGSGNGSGGGGENKGYWEYYAYYNGRTFTGKTQAEASSAAMSAKRTDLATTPKGLISHVNYDTGKSVTLYELVSNRQVTIGTRQWKYYKTGGLADFTGPAWLDGTKSRPELVLNQRDTENFIQLKDILSSILSHNLGNSTSTENNGDITYDIDINVESIGSDYDVDKVASRVKTLITEDARYRNNNAVSLKR